MSEASKQASPSTGVVTAFLSSVSFRPGNRNVNGHARLHLEDMWDGHVFEFNVPVEFGRHVTDCIQKEDFDETEARMLIALSPCVLSEAPTAEQLLAVWQASAFVDDVAADRHCCAVCDRRLPEEMDSVEPCEPECPGALLRAARRRGKSVSRGIRVTPG